MTDDHDTDELEQRLVDAWKRAPAPTPTPEWKAGVMRAVRAQHTATGESEAAATDWGASVLVLVRNGLFAAAAAAAAAILAYAFVGGTTRAPSDELVRLIGQDPHAILELFWVL